ncbi:MAG: helix-turn-helix domain-containing protein [Nitrososphaerota archaeon]|nr:helix-turn-helix domain-containing protein [Nitrososphaerota archaeon]
MVNRAKIILAIDTSQGRKKQTCHTITNHLNISYQAVHDTKKRFLTAKNVTEFLQRKKRQTPPTPPKITGETEAHIIAIACSKAPNGQAKWTLRLIADKCVELHYIDSISHMSVSRLLKKHNLHPT